MKKKVKNKFNSFERTYVLDIKFKGFVRKALNYSESKNLVVRLKASKGQESIFNDSVSSNIIDIKNIIFRGVGSVQLIIEGEGKLQSEDKTGLFAKGKGAKIVLFKQEGESLIPSRKEYVSVQVGLQIRGERRFYTQWTSINPDLRSFIMVFWDKKIVDHEIKFPKEWGVELENNGKLEIKYKDRFKINYKKEEVNEIPSLVTSDKRRGKPKFTPYLFYAGVLFTIGVMFAEDYAWDLPFFKDYRSAYLTSLSLTAGGLSWWSYKTRRFHLATGICLVTIGGLSWWEDWTLPLIKHFELPLVIGFTLIITEIHSKGVAIALMLAGGILLLIMIVDAIKHNFDSIPRLSWLVPLILFFIGIRLFKSLSKGNNNNHA
jgi:hypothetical protein